MLLRNFQHVSRNCPNYFMDSKEPLSKRYFNPAIPFLLVYQIPDNYYPYKILPASVSMFWAFKNKMSVCFNVVHVAISAKPKLSVLLIPTSGSMFSLRVDILISLITF